MDKNRGSNKDCTREGRDRYEKEHKNTGKERGFIMK